jgi:dipeptidyl aminopeptidase/acylaminoacyl peptidase
LCLAASAAALVIAATPLQATAAPPSAADFARRPAIQSVVLAPDGKHLAAVTSRDGEETLIAVWRTDALDKPPVLLGAGRRSNFVGIDFVKNDRIVAFIQQNYTRGSDRRHLIRAFITDLQGGEWRTALGDEDQSEAETQGVLDRLPRDPRNILVESRGDVWKVDVYSGAKERIDRASDKFGGRQTDLTGQIRARQELEFDSKGVYIAQQLRNPTSGAWEEHFRSYARERDLTEVVGFTTDPNIVLVRTSKGRDRAGIYEYDIRTRKISEPAFEHKVFDALDVMQSENAADYGEIIGFVYQGDRVRDYWADPAMDGVAKSLRQALKVQTTPVRWTDIATGEQVNFTVGDGADVDIVSWSDDRRWMVVEKSGPKQPPEYYVVIPGKGVQLLGRSAPQIDAAALGDTRLVQYKARDGLTIPAYLTTPPKSVHGAGPYPSIILPHGGPWARDTLDWDGTGWTQYFAARGYAVLQPQFRGSEGWGQKLWRAGDAEWGRKMQDDKDDGARWLIAQGVADPQRIAMHGYSYGGYAAMAAAVRPNGLYQCAVAGAGVADLATIKRQTFNNSYFQREYQRPTVEGLDPLAEASKVSIPVLLYHGDRDTTVEIKHSRQFNSALRGQGKPVKYVELKDMGHQGNFWSPENTRISLAVIEDFLKTDCGPGGL